VADKPNEQGDEHISTFFAIFETTKRIIILSKIYSRDIVG
jgi:hypothetical protein